MNWTGAIDTSKLHLRVSPVGSRRPRWIRPTMSRRRFVLARPRQLWTKPECSTSSGRSCSKGTDRELSTDVRALQVLGLDRAFEARMPGRGVPTRVVVEDQPISDDALNQLALGPDDALVCLQPDRYASCQSGSECTASSDREDPGCGFGLRSKLDEKAAVQAVVEPIGNAIRPGDAELDDGVALLDGIRAAQERGGLHQDDQLRLIVETDFGEEQRRFPNISVEMETGTGRHTPTSEPR